jgi:hypothetical protein
MEDPPPDLTGPTMPMQPTLMSATPRAATLTPRLSAVISVITITGIGDHLRPEWLITFTGMRTRASIECRSLKGVLFCGRQKRVYISSARWKIRFLIPRNEADIGQTPS